MMEVRGTDRVFTSGHMRDLPSPWGTADLADEVVNQRVVATVWMGNNDQRSGRWGVGVWMDREAPEDSGKPFIISGEGWRGMDGVGLTPSEARYVGAILHQAARRLMAAAGVDVP